MSAAVAVNTPMETKWTVISGPMKGVVRLMSQTHFSIGRSTECEFVIVNDPKCSRKHATINITTQGCEVISHNEKNFVLVNGKEFDRKILRDSDVLTLGETEIKYNSTVQRLDPVHMAVARPQPHYPNAAHPMSPARRGRGPAKKSSAPRLLIYFVIGIFFLFLMTPTKKKKQGIDLRTQQQIQTDIEVANELKKTADADSIRKIDQTVTARQAQENYVRGFRDFQKGQFERSMVSFQACLALNPEHVLCNRYIKWSQRKFDEVIQIQVVYGRKYRDQNQFKACRNAFRNVMVMVKDANSPVFKEAKANYEACNSFVEGRY